MEMYRMRPYSSEAAVEPAKIMYHLGSYHPPKLQEFSANDPAKEAAFLKLCDTKISSLDNNGGQSQSENEELAQQLRALSKRLDTFIAKCSEKGAKKESKDSKTDKKAAKKTEKEAPKATTDKAKSIQQEVPKQQKKAKAAKENNITTPVSNSPDVVHANILPTSRAVFPIHDYDANGAKRKIVAADHRVECHFRDADRALVALLKRVGDKRNVQFVEGGGKAADGKVAIKSTFGAKALKLVDQYESEKQEVTDEQAVWKLLGSILGLYAAEDGQVSALQDSWLAQNVATTELDRLSRCLSTHLGGNDFLSSQHAICLADLVLRARFSQKGQLVEWNALSAANNVQLWAKRVDEALKALS